MIATPIIAKTTLITKHKMKTGNIKSFVSLGAEKGVFGELCTAWCDDTGNHSEIFWIGFLASPEYAWNSENHDIQKARKDI
jgi:hexosaminidase